MITPDERHHVNVAMEDITKVRAYMHPLAKHRLGEEVLRNLEHCLVLLALLSYSSEERPVVRPKLFQG